MEKEKNRLQVIGSVGAQPVEVDLRGKDLMITKNEINKIAKEISGSYSATSERHQ